MTYLLFFSLFFSHLTGLNRANVRPTHSVHAQGVSR